MSSQLARTDGLRALALLSPAYLWLTVAVFLPLSAMVFFSFLSDSGQLPHLLRDADLCASVVEIGRACANRHPAMRPDRLSLRLGASQDVQGPVA